MAAAAAAPAWARAPPACRARIAVDGALVARVHLDLAPISAADATSAARDDTSAESRASAEAAAAAAAAVPSGDADAPPIQVGGGGGAARRGVGVINSMHPNPQSLSLTTPKP